MLHLNNRWKLQQHILRRVGLNLSLLKNGFAWHDHKPNACNVTLKSYAAGHRQWWHVWWWVIFSVTASETLTFSLQTDVFFGVRSVLCVRELSDSSVWKSAKRSLTNERHVSAIHFKLMRNGPCSNTSLYTAALGQSLRGEHTACPLLAQI